MIDLSKLTDADVGQVVVYRARHPGAKPEPGTVSSWNDRFVFVLYDGKRTPQATSPGDLDFEFQKGSKR